MGISSLVLFLSLGVLIFNAPELDAQGLLRASDELYKNIVIGDYASAISETREILKEGKGDEIKQVVTKLMRDGKSNVVEYGYQLWKADLQEAVKEHFPLQFRIIFAGNFVKFISRRDGLAIKLGNQKDSDGDRLAYGDAHDKTSERISWSMIPLWENNRVYFKILNSRDSQYLKVGLKANDTTGDHRGFGTDLPKSSRNDWYLQPVEFEYNVLFFIFNREYSQALKLDQVINSDGDRAVWSHEGEALGNPEVFGWYIVPV